MQQKNAQGGGSIDHGQGVAHNELYILFKQSQEIEQRKGQRQAGRKNQSLSPTTNRSALPSAKRNQTVERPSMLSKKKDLEMHDQVDAF